MRRIIVFNSVTFDGYFTGKDGDMSWAHKQDPEWNAFITDNAKGGGELLFGRTTYDMMKSYWPTPQAMKDAPILAERMNNLPKVVFSRTLDKVSWNNTRLVNGDIAAEVRKMKQESGPGMVIMGSGSIISLLAGQGLIDELQMVINPIALGDGKTMFVGMQKKLTLKLLKTRAFGNGNVLACYEPTS